MAEIVVFPMTYAVFSRQEDVVAIAWANSSNRVVRWQGPGPPDFFGMHLGLAMSTLLSAGWKEIERGEVMR